MKKNEVKIGECCMAKVTGSEVPVHIAAENSHGGWNAMDLVAGAKTVIVMTDHCDKKGNPKILKQCRLPLTAAGEVDFIVTDLCVLQMTDVGLTLKELAPGATVKEVLEKTEAILIVPEKIGSMV